MVTIYHNPRCSKSREGLEFIESKGLNYQVIRYLEQPFTFETLSEVIEKLKIKPIELVRTKEATWKELFSDKNLSDKEIISALVEHPKLIERPIVVYKDKAIIARPMQKISEIL